MGWLRWNCKPQQQRSAHFHWGDFELRFKGHLLVMQLQSSFIHLPTPNPSHHVEAGGQLWSQFYLSCGFWALNSSFRVVRYLLRSLIGPFHLLYTSTHRASMDQAEEMFPF